MALLSVTKQQHRDAVGELTPGDKPKESAIADIIGLSHGWRARALDAESRLDAFALGRDRARIVAALLGAIAFVEGAALLWHFLP